MREIEILDPSAGEEPLAWPLAPGLPESKPSRFGLLDISKPQGDVFLDALESLLADRGHAVSRYRKPTTARPATRELVRRIVAECDAAVVALAD